MDDDDGAATSVDNAIVAAAAVFALTLACRFLLVPRFPLLMLPSYSPRLPYHLLCCSVIFL